MNGLFVKKDVAQEELRKWRKSITAPEKRGYRRDVLFQSRRTEYERPEQTQGDTAYVSRPAQAFTKKDARTVRDAMNDRRYNGVMRLAAKDPAWFKAYAQHLRAQNPTLVAHLTDEQIVRTIMERANQEAVQRTFARSGRNGYVIQPGR